MGNTYHLGNYPGESVLRELGGLHKLMNWKNNLLTDSGGFQMVSLFDLSEVGGLVVVVVVMVVAVILTVCCGLLVGRVCAWDKARISEGVEGE